MSLYAEVGGVDYKKIQPFKDTMKLIASRTTDFPLRRRSVLFLIRMAALNTLDSIPARSSR